LSHAGKEIARSESELKWKAKGLLGAVFQL
jgi:hypothetical protein